MSTVLRTQIILIYYIATFVHWSNDFHGFVLLQYNTYKAYISVPFTGL